MQLGRASARTPHFRPHIRCPSRANALREGLYIVPHRASALNSSALLRSAARFASRRAPHLTACATIPCCAGIPLFHAEKGCAVRVSSRVRGRPPPAPGRDARDGWSAPGGQRDRRYVFLRYSYDTHQLPSFQHRANLFTVTPRSPRRALLLTSSWTHCSRAGQRCSSPHAPSRSQPQWRPRSRPTCPCSAQASAAARAGALRARRGTRTAW